MQPVYGGAIGRRGGPVQARHVRAERPRVRRPGAARHAGRRHRRRRTPRSSGNGSAPKLTAPADMKQLIARYDAELEGPPRRDCAGRLDRQPAPAYAYPVASLKTLPPVRPAVQFNAGGNYVEHTEGIAANQARGGGARAGARGAGAPAADGRAPGHLGAPGGRHARQPVPVPEVADHPDRQRRPDRRPARPHQSRFRVRVHRRHRQARQVCLGGQRRRLHLRLHRSS